MALNVGGSLLGRMKALGGLAVASAHGYSPDTRGPMRKPNNGSRAASERKSTFVSIFVSKNALAAAGNHEKRLPYVSSAVGDEAGCKTISTNIFDDTGLVSSSHRVLSSISPPQSAVAWIETAKLHTLLPTQGTLICMVRTLGQGSSHTS